MTDLTARLAEALDRADAAARDLDLTGASWYSVDDLSRPHHDGGAGLDERDAVHMAAWCPARVLLLITRDRQLLTDHAETTRVYEGNPRRDQYAAGRLCELQIAVEAAAKFWMPDSPTGG